MDALASFFIYKKKIIMKYIKLFENEQGHQFEEGDYVRLSYAKNKNLIF